MTNKKDKRIQKIRIRNLRKNLFISFTSSILLTKSLLLAQKQKNCILARIFARIFRYNLKLIELQAKKKRKKIKKKLYKKFLNYIDIAAAYVSLNYIFLTFCETSLYFCRFCNEIFSLLLSLLISYNFFYCYSSFL